MEFTMSPEIRGDSHLAALVGRTRAVLEGIVGGSSEPVSANWTIARSGERPVLSFNLSDSKHTKVELFTPKDLEDEAGLRDRLHGTWGDLLELRLSEIVKRLESMLPDEAIP